MANKVLFVHDGPMYTDASGNVFGIHYNDKIVDRYAQLGSEVTFLMRKESIGDSSSTTLSKITRDNFSFVSVPNFKSISTYFVDKPKAKKIINETVAKNDIIVVRMPSATGVIAINAAKKFNKPYLVEMVACTFDGYWNYNWKGKLIAVYKYLKTVRFVKHSPFVLYVTNEFLQSRYPTNGKSIGCSDVELNDINNNTLANRLNKINLDENSVLKLTTVAALDVPYKGQGDVIRAIHLLKKEGIIIHYYLVGQGSSALLTELAKKLEIENQVHVVGALKFEKIFEFLDGMDVYIQPSKQEGLPRAMIEAMSRGLPALGANTAGIPELISKKCIFKAGNINEVKEKIKLINKNWLIDNAHENFEKSKEYKRDILEERRKKFYQEFLKSYLIE
jgi:glycosyltransferase involved in cell wall biosynthesis